MLRALQLQMQIWQAASRLGSPDDVERVNAMQTLYLAGHASIPALRRVVRTPYARKQFAAAVVLHRLGEPEGMITLKEALLWRLATDLELAPELEAAFVAIGAPDAVTTLIDMWGKFSDWGDNYQALTLICRVWATLRDPRALDSLTERAQRIPELFVQTVPAFGQMAIPYMERMTREHDSQRRILAISALGGINAPRSFATLVPLLRDPDPEVRAAVPAALVTSGGTREARETLIEAIKVAFSSRAAIEILARLGPPPYEVLLELIARWNPQNSTPKGDTGGAVLAALSILAHAPWPNSRLITPLCELLKRNPGVELTARIAYVLGVRGKSGTAIDYEARDALWPLLAHADSSVREEASQALGRLGDSLGRQWVQLLADCRPQGSLLTRLETLLRGGPDASMVAAQAMQQVSQWVSRVSRETVEKLAAPPGAKLAPPACAQDSRVPELLRSLLNNSLDSLFRVTTPADVEQNLAVTVSVIRALGRVGIPAALSARDGLLRALRCVKRNVVYEGNASGPFRRSEVREVGEMVRLAAAETLMELYGPESFPLLLEALYAPQMECVVTAVLALGRLGDVRALPHIQHLLNHTAMESEPGRMSPLAVAANQAIAAIRRTNPEMMTLLRASSAADTQIDTLLRPAASGPPDTAPETLLRPSAQNPIPEG
jgi:HEAT repeat protein